MLGERLFFVFLVNHGRLSFNFSIRGPSQVTIGSLEGSGSGSQTVYKEDFSDVMNSYYC